MGQQVAQAFEHADVTFAGRTDRRGLVTTAYGAAATGATSAGDARG